MASSSVSQDDIDNDFEKNNRRSRIRTARARQINPSGCRVESNNMVDQQQIDVDQLGGDEGGASNGALTQPSGGAGGVSSTSSNAINKYDKLMAAPEENAEHETSPKPIMRGGGRKEEKRPNKMHHSNKGKQQRDRRKLREKRRSTGTWILGYMINCNVFCLMLHVGHENAVVLRAFDLCRTRQNRFETDKSHLSHLK